MGLASLFICSSRLVILVAVTARWRCCNNACRRGLKASPLVRLTRFSSACSIPSIARCCQWLKVIQLTFNWRQTSAGLHRSVHTASTAWTLSGALTWGAGVRFFRSVFFSLVVILVEVISKFLFVVLLITDTEFELAFLGAQHDGLSVHASHHVERSLGFAAQGQFQKVFLNTLFDGAAQLRLDLEEAVGRTQSFDALMRPLVVVIFDPEFDAFAGGLEAVELGAG